MKIYNNWFKVSIIFVLIFLCFISYKYVQIGQQKDLASEQEKCREAGVKIDQEQRDAPIGVDSPSITSMGYYYNPELQTCLEAYNYQMDKYTSSIIKDDETHTGYGIKDLYNNVDIYTCIDSWNQDEGIHDDMVMTENKNGIGYGKDIVVSEKNSSKWSPICAKPFKELTGGKFWSIPDDM